MNYNAGLAISTFIELIIDPGTFESISKLTAICPNRKHAKHSSIRSSMSLFFLCYLSMVCFFSSQIPNLPNLPFTHLLLTKHDHLIKPRLAVKHIVSHYFPGNIIDLSPGELIFFSQFLQALQ